jgi:ubiquinone/menaquinone biosynthesis C-methylase UbiE
MTVSTEQHYTRDHLLEKILSALKNEGIDPNRITRKELAVFDEFHVRGAEVTKELAAEAGLLKEMKVLDVGCGIGGPCRYIAEEYGCETTGIDITQEYIRAASGLSALAGLGDRTRFIQASALNLPFPDNSFDQVWTQHVQMNIPDKKQFYAEIYRVLKPGGSFIYYDILSEDHQTICFPVPWAETPVLSHLVTIDELHTICNQTGFRIIETRDQTEAGIQSLSSILERTVDKGFPPLSLQVLIGDSLGEKLANLYRNLMGKKLRLESGACSKE